MLATINLNNHSSIKIIEKDEIKSENNLKNINKNAIDLTTARFRMLVNSEDFARPFEAKVDNNLPKQRYSNINLITHFSEIAYNGFDDKIITDLIKIHKKYRQFYFNLTYCKYFNKISLNSPLIIYKINNLKSEISIDNIIKWYPIFPKNPSKINNKKQKLIKQEQLNFLQHLKLEFREILLEFYEFIDFFTNKMLNNLINIMELFFENLTEKCLEPFKLINEICKKCGESFNNKIDLINHHDFNGCKMSPIHRCQCGDIFMTHFEWQNHCFNKSMNCATFSWHIWRHKRLSTYYSYICDGCQHIYDGFLRFWNHICNCPFFLSFIIGNCSFCTSETKLEFYLLPETVTNIGKSHSDKVGIDILRDLTDITEIKFNYKLAIERER